MILQLLSHLATNCIEEIQWVNHRHSCTGVLAKSYDGERIAWLKTVQQAYGRTEKSLIHVVRASSLIT